MVTASGHSTTTYTGGNPIVGGSHDQGLIVKMFKDGDPKGATAIPARATLGPKWQEAIKEGLRQRVKAPYHAFCPPRLACFALDTKRDHSREMCCGGHRVGKNTERALRGPPIPAPRFPALTCCFLSSRAMPWLSGGDRRRSMTLASSWRFLESVYWSSVSSGLRGPSNRR